MSKLIISWESIRWTQCSDPLNHKGSSYAAASLVYEGTSILTGNLHMRFSQFSTRVRRTTTRGAAGSMTRTGPITVSTAFGTTWR